MATNQKKLTLERTLSVIGSPFVGKSAISEKFFLKSFPNKYYPTIEKSICTFSKTLSQLNLWGHFFSSLFKSSSKELSKQKWLLQFDRVRHGWPREVGFNSRKIHKQPWLYSCLQRNQWTIVSVVVLFCFDKN